jgi:cold-inducible RNA-binding protein
MQRYCPFLGGKLLHRKSGDTGMGKRLYVSNISNRATEESVRGLFTAIGRVESTHLITNARTGKPKGMAFLVMAVEEEAEQAIAALNGTLLHGRPLKVSAANTQEPRERRDLDTVGGRKNEK